MSVYVDRLASTRRSKLWRWAHGCHLVADTVAELHTFARRIGCRRGWFQPNSFPHYDLTPGRRVRALRQGAKAIDRLELVGLMRRWRACQTESRKVGGV